MDEFNKMKDSKKTSKIIDNLATEEGKESNEDLMQVQGDDVVTDPKKTPPKIKPKRGRKPPVVYRKDVKISKDKKKAIKICKWLVYAALLPKPQKCEACQKSKLKLKSYSYSKFRD